MLVQTAIRNLKFPKDGKFYTHQFCDYIEMLLLLKSDGGYSADDVFSNLVASEKSYLRRKITGEEKKEDELGNTFQKLYKQDDDSEEVAIDDEDLDDGECDGEITGHIQPEKDDKAETFLKTIFVLLNDRKNHIKNYPFIVEEEYISLAENLTRNQKQYLMLLIQSNHKIFGDHSHQLTKDFEKVTYCTLIKYFPTHAKILELGKTSNTQTRAIEKIVEICKQMRVSINEANLKDISYDNKQEEGTDIIAWIPFDDLNMNKLIFLFQSTCQHDWYEKQFQPRRYLKLFNFSLKPTIGFFIPHLFNEGERFHRDFDVDEETLLFDRARILYFTSRKVGCITKLDSYKLVDRILTLK